jgi:hypothetical protein
MDPRKKSALTAALSSPGDDQAAGRTKGSTQKDDLSSFPCLSENTSAENASELSKALVQMGLERKGSLAGSAPTTGLAGGFTVCHLALYTQNQALHYAIDYDKSYIVFALCRILN